MEVTLAEMKKIAEFFGLDIGTYYVNTDEGEKICGHWLNLNIELTTNEIETWER